MTIIGLLAAFGAGIFGAAIGAIPAFIFVGILVIAGVAADVGAAPGATDFLGLVPFGVFGPHVGGFVSGVAAAAYAAKVGKLDSGKSVLTGLMGLNSADILLVGGLFAVIGYVIQWGFAQVPDFGPGIAWTDTVALTVVTCGIITRLAFGKTGAFGTPAAGTSRYANPDPATLWLPFQSTPSQLLTIGLGVGLFAGFLGINLGGPGVFLAFGLAATSLIFLQFGVNVPVTHHIALPAAIAAAASGSLVWAAIVGIAGAFAGEFFARTFHNSGDTHIDPPAAAIATLTLIVNFAAAAGILTAIQIPF